MCPRLPSSNSTESTATRELTVITEWAATACCVIAILRRHLVSRIIICDNCFARLRPQRQCLYERVVRHYIKLGNYPAEERCSLCGRELAGIVPVRGATCGVCPNALSGFLEYIARHRLTPYNEPEPTVVVIREFRF